MQYCESMHWKISSFIYLLIVLRDNDCYPFHDWEEMGALEDCESILVSRTHFEWLANSTFRSDGLGPCLLGFFWGGVGDLVDSHGWRRPSGSSEAMVFGGAKNRAGTLIWENWANWENEGLGVWVNWGSTVRKLLVSCIGQLTACLEFSQPCSLLWLLLRQPAASGCDLRAPGLSSITG